VKALIIRALRNGGLTMKKRVWGLMLLTLGMLSVSREAAADEAQVDPVLVLGFLGVAALDVGLVSADLVIGAQGERPSRGYGGFEAAVGGAQFAICLDKALANGSASNPGGWALGTIFGGILLAHGLVTLLAPHAHIEAPPAPGPVTVAPLALSDVARTSVPGLAVLGRF